MKVSRSFSLLRSSCMHQVCPAGHWCPERTVVPNKCDALSICAEGSTFQINFFNALIMGILCFLTIALGYLLRSRQKARDVLSHQKEPNFRRQASRSQSQSQSQSQERNSHMESRPGILNMSFKNIHYRTAANRVILPNICGKIPAGKISAILGPTAW